MAAEGEVGKHSLLLEKNTELKNQGLSSSSTDQWLQENSIISVCIKTNKQTNQETYFK